MSISNSKRQAQPDLPLNDVCVIEIGHSLAAPYAGQIFANLGARVVKIESASAGDYARGWGPPFIGNDSALFHAVNHGKESCRADFNDPASVAAIRSFIETHADVVIQNLKPGSLAKYGLDSDSLMVLKPSLIYCNLGAFGAVGPLRDKPGYDPLVQAYSGMMSIVGNDSDAPSRVPISLNDMGTGMWAVIGVMGALRERDHFGRRQGQVIDVSLYETALAWMTVPLSDCLADGKLPVRLGSGSPNIVPYQVFRCADENILVAAGNDTLYQRLCKTLGLPELIKDERFETNALRVSHRSALIPLLQNRFAQKPAEYWITRLEEESIPCGPIQTVDRVIASEQTAALGMLCTTPDGSGKTVALPLSFNGQRPPPSGNTPKLGQHDHILNITTSLPRKLEEKS
jgi:crotonobetainyl-CoA:carnitine CoA-transferase CaiB-like acyl-CoA transferase